jgi:hypothetical protein
MPETAAAAAAANGKLADEIASLRRARDASLAAALAAEERQRKLEQEIARAERSTDARQTLPRLREQLDAARSAAQQARDAHGELRAAVRDRLGQWVKRSPAEIVAGLPDDDPLVMLPVRIETRFARRPQGDTRAQQVELRVRIYPDDIAIGSAPEPLSAEERSDGEAYWRARSSAAAPGAGSDEQLRYEGAWNAIAVRRGEYRGGWMVRETLPNNWDPSRGDPNPGPGGLIFPGAAAPVDPPLPRANALPDCFAVLLIADGAVVKTQIGLAVPDDLALGPDASDAGTWLTRDPLTGRLVAADGLKWLIDFDAAEKVGMAVRMPLESPWDTRGFDRLLVIGVRGAADEADGANTLEALLAKHRYGAGCSIVRQGTPTNNTDSALSGWQPASSEAAQLFSIEDAPPKIQPVPGVLGTNDGWRLHRLLGLSEDFVRRLPNAASTDIAEALAMNRAAVPGTLDDFVHEFLNGVVTPAAGATLHRFFIDHVSGRGLYPALRVGRQPYGIVVTSAWSRWQQPKAGVITRAGFDIEAGLHALIAAHRARWDALGHNAARAAQATDQPFERLMRIIGQLASSAEFSSRKAVSDAYVSERLRFGGAAAEAIREWFDRLSSARSAHFSEIGFPPALAPKEPLLAAIAFLAETDRWQAALVDRDPAVPLSERDGIAAFDGTRNYLHWLATASRADLVAERFTGADGASVTRPAALLYALLRQALLAALEQDVLGFARDKGQAYFDVIERDPLIANIGTAQHVLRRDYFEVDAARLGLAARPKALADFVLEDAPALPLAERGDAVRVAEAREALLALTGLPTARLERLMAEHIDLCSYRLDAWIGALYGARLETMLDRAQSDERTPRRHLGAYGWLENVRPVTPETRRVLAADEVPPALRTSAAATVFEDSANGGFVHAPSLAQAASAAVLRNAYLSHASDAAPLPFSINLSSARMRAATELTQGVRNGQPIAALLGYQLERGLHEGHSGLELDATIYVLRDRFPLVSGLLAETPPGKSVETVEARNVVHGLNLLEATTSGVYPWGIALMPAAGTNEALAVIAEIDRLRDGLDAVADLQLAESVHQAVQGNVARAGGALQSLTEPQSAAEPDLLRTPRSGRVLAFRCVIALDPAAVTGWPGATPRGDANRPLNHWLAQHLPAPDKIIWTVRHGAAAPASVALSDVGLQPIDLVLMSGDRLGDRSSELERYLIRRFRFDAGVADELATVVTPEPPPANPALSVEFDFSGQAPGAVSLASLQPLVARLRRLVTKARPMHALDAWLSTDIDALDAAADPTGSASGDPLLDDFKDFRDRLTSAFNALTAVAATLQAALAALAPLRAALDADASTITNPQWPPRLQALRQALFGALPFGLAEALPADGISVSRVLVDNLIGQGLGVAKLIEKRLTLALEQRSASFPALPATEPALSRELARRRDLVRRNLLDAARSLFGPSYVAVPLYRFHAVQAPELANAAGTPVTSDTFAIEAWLQSVARVRPRVADVVWASAAARWQDKPFADPSALQLPHRPGAPWIAGAIGTQLARGEQLSLVALDGLPAAAGLQAGLVIDDWSETVPEARETTGVSFHFNRPNAVAPQALLVVVPPAQRGHWEWDDVVGGVNEALDLAKLRAVEPDALAAGPHFQVLPAILSEFTQARFASVHWAARSVATALKTE